MYRYNVIDQQRAGKEDIFDFVPITSKEKKPKMEARITTKLALPTKSPSYRYKKQKVGLLGSKPSSGFRSSSSLQGYHSSTSPDSFLKKKYVAADLGQATRRIVSGSLASVAKEELYKHIMQQYRKGGVRMRKKKLRRRKHRTHKSR